MSPVDWGERTGAKERSGGFLAAACFAKVEIAASGTGSERAKVASVDIMGWRDRLHRAITWVSRAST
jgi:hypothetical protein